MSHSRPLFVYFRPFCRTIQILNWKMKRRYCAWDSNTGLEEGRRRQIHWAMVVCFINLLLLKMCQPRPLFHLFSSFQTHITIFTTNKCEKCPSSILCRDSNSQPLEYESPPITTRPGLLPCLTNLTLMLVAAKKSWIRRRSNLWTVIKRRCENVEIDWQKTQSEKKNLQRSS